MKNVVKVMLMVALFCPAAFADGDMGGGGLSDPGVDSRSGKTVITQTTEDDGDMGGGGKLFDSGYLGSVLDSIYYYFDRMI